MNTKKLIRITSASVAMAIFLIANATPAFAATSEQLAEILQRLEKLESENQSLKEQVRDLMAQQTASATIGSEKESKQDSKSTIALQTNQEYGFKILDPLTHINRKQQLILKAKQDGVVGANTINVQGAVTAIANYQSSNEPNLFGYLMRHPTSNNQRGKTVSEATIHSSQLGFTANLGDWTTAHAELLFDPEQSFGAGTNTALTRNQVQVRKAYVLFGNLDESPWYASLGKMAIPFGLTDTVNPFTNSTVWHAFGGLANGGIVGYQGKNLNMSFMAVQGGAQFRSANVPVEGTAVPSKLNNFAIDASYTSRFNDGEILVGASYQKGSAYCQGFPITHFTGCEEENGAYDIYAKFDKGPWTLKAEFAKTEDEWPGTFNPAIPQFAASKVSSFDIGAQYRSTLFGMPTAYSAEFSNFEAGPAGSEWEKQDQLVLGVAMYPLPSVKLFSEYIDVNGYAPLNFLNGGHIPGMPQTPASDASADSEIIMFGANIAF